VAAQCGNRGSATARVAQGNREASARTTRLTKGRIDDRASLLDHAQWQQHHNFLEESGLPYRIVPVNISAGDQFKPEFLKFRRTPHPRDRRRQSGGARAADQRARRLGRDVFLRQNASRRDGEAVMRSLTARCSWCGENDALTPLSEHRELAAMIKTEQLCVIPGSGHMTPMEKSEAVTAGLRAWLTR
jgi:pimeloyl-ACP methyl ester carboxylesterase